MNFTVDQSAGARDSDVIRRLLIQCDGKEPAQRERIGQAPRDPSLTFEALKEADHHDAEILARRKRRASQLMVIEVGAGGLAENIELGVVEDFVEPFIEGMAWGCRQLAAVPKVRLSLSHLPRAHRHSSIVRPKHFQSYMFVDFRHGLLRARNRSGLTRRQVEAVAQLADYSCLPSLGGPTAKKAA